MFSMYSAEPAAVIAYTLIFFSLYFQVFLMLTFLEKRTFIGAEKKRRKGHYPSVTIIVPCFNEEATVVKTIESLLALNYPKGKLCIVAVDDGSTDRTWQILKQFDEHPQISLLQKSNGGKHTALNLALAQVKTDLVGCLDADSFVLPETLSSIIPYFENKEVMAVTPAIKVTNTSGMISRLQYVEYIVSIFIRKMLGMIDAIQVTPGPFSIFRTKVFENLGGYRKAHNTEDMEMALRLHKNHYKIVNSHEAVVLTTPPQTLKGLYKQRLRWTYGFLKNVIDYREMFLHPRYGNLAMFTLPAAVISIFSVLYCTAYLLMHFGDIVNQKIVEVSVIGLNMPKLHLSWEWFLPNYQTTAILSLVLFTFSLLSILGGSVLSREKSIPKGFFPYILLYGFIAPLWLWSAVINVVRSHQSSWR